MDAIAGERASLPIVTTELQHTFPGCYSVMHDIKSAQRHGEQLLEQAGRAADALSADDAERRNHHVRLDAAWEDLLLTEFHDILTGTSIPSAWPSVRAMQGRARIVGEEVLYDVTRRWSYRALPKANEQQIVVINTGDSPFTGYVEAEPYLDFDDWHDRWLADEKGAAVPFQQVQPDSNQLIPRILFPAEITARGHRIFQVRHDAAPKTRMRKSRLSATRRQIANDDITVSLAPGGIAQIAHKGVALLGRGGISLQLRHDSTDTWTFHTDRWEAQKCGLTERLSGGKWHIEEAGELRVRARLDGRIGNSRVTWTVSLYDREPRNDLDLEVNFDERFTLLQMPIRLAAKPSRWTDGVAGASIARKEEHAEWPFLGWSRMRVAAPTSVWSRTMSIATAFALKRGHQHCCAALRCRGRRPASSLFRARPPYRSGCAPLPHPVLVRPFAQRGRSRRGSPSSRSAVGRFSIATRA